MVDLNQERKAFEADQNTTLLFERIEYIAAMNAYMPKFEYANNLMVMQAAERFNFGWSMWQKAKAQAVPDTHVLVEKKDIENWYLDESEYMWFEADGMDGYLEDIDIGEVVEVQRKEYVVINSNPVFAAKAWDESDKSVGQWDFFESKEEAEKAAAHCKAMFEASESGAEG